MLSTIHRRHIIEFISQEKTISQRILKEKFVDSGEMNQTTLYRILERFCEEGILHRADFDHEKFFTLCQCGEKKEEAVKLKCCVSCHNIEDNHTPLSPESLSSETIELVKHCEKCEG